MENMGYRGCVFKNKNGIKRIVQQIIISEKYKSEVNYDEKDKYHKIDIFSDIISDFDRLFRVCDKNALRELEIQ